MDIRQFLFRNRSYTPIPLALAILYFADPNWPLAGFGVLLMAAGEGIRLKGVHVAGGATRTRKVGAPVLYTDGPFAYVRNPLYLGNMMLYSGVVLSAGGPMVWPLLAVTVAFFISQYSFIISLEEETLLDRFGDSYRKYMDAVPRLLPRLNRWSGGKRVTPPPWSKTIRTERRTLQILAVFLILMLGKVFII